MSPLKIPDDPLHFGNRDEWRLWLQENHAAQTEAWLVISKSRSANPGIFYEEAVEEALCFGWIDGVMHSSSGDFFYQRFSPRKRGSLWSVSNQKRVERLVAQGKMTETGLAKVTEAQANGEWEAAIRREDTSTVPDDLKTALEGSPEAQANYEKYPPSQRKQFLYWILSTRTEATRQKRIQSTVEMIANHKRLGE